jgi:hypothetical protein
MMTLPLLLADKLVLIVILEQDNLIRVKNHDPAIFHLSDYAQAGIDISGYRADQVELHICYEKDTERLMSFHGARHEKAVEMWNWLHRGDTDQPGDDIPATPLPLPKGKHDA